MDNRKLTNADLAEIKKRAEAAAEAGVGSHEDSVMRFHARQDVPALLAEVERLNAQLSELICAIYEYEPDGTALMALAERIDADGEEI